tara:strand:+ start:5915 stop:6352 length:438 start_codon:yes stop_codon:yes gene_type:complete
MSETLWNPESIGERLKSERRRLGLSQEKFAEAGGIKRTTLYQYEHGDRRPSLDFLLQCTSAGLDLAYVIFGERNLRLAGSINIEQSELDQILALVDQYARDSRGRALATEHRQELFRQLCEMANTRTQDEVDWDAIENTAREFAA